MSRSLSLAAYMAYARRSAQDAPALYEVGRPAGELVWAHAVDMERANALCQIADRLANLRPEFQMILTLADEAARPDRQTASVVTLDLPPESLGAVDAFLDHWRPNVCLWTGGDLRPALLTRADECGVPLYLIDAEENLLDRPRWRWFPDLPRAVLRRFAQVQARSTQAARALRRIGIADTDITVTGPLRSEAIPLPFDETERAELAALLLGRPIWLVAHLHPEELEIVLAARRKVSRLSHRLVIVIAPEDPVTLPQMREELERQGLRVAVSEDGDLPTETTQVVLIDLRDDLGLWYRLAPFCLMGGSLVPGLGGYDPNEPAVHGTAMLYGPNVRRYLQEYSRFAEMRAARIVRDAETLAGAVGQLLAPDQAAAMAHAAWDVASQSAEVSDRVTDLVQDTLDVMRER